MRQMHTTFPSQSIFTDSISTEPISTEPETIDLTVAQASSSSGVETGSARKQVELEMRELLIGLVDRIVTNEETRRWSLVQANGRIRILIQIQTKRRRSEK